MNYKDIVSADQRSLILQALHQDPSYSHNQGVLHSVLGAIGHDVSMDVLRSHLRWLEELGLVTLTDMELVGLIAHINQRGIDVALGRAIIDGVARPRPGNVGR